jgi:hypothetical protein
MDANAETAKRFGKWTLLHTGQMVGAVVLIWGAIQMVGVPAAKEFIIKATDSRIGKVEKSFKEYRTEQRSVQQRQEGQRRKVINQQSAIIERQRIGEILQAEQRSDIKELLRLYRRRMP